MNPSPTMLAIVTDAFGGRGGIAQYNRDFLGALAATGAVSSITVLPRQAPDLPMLPERIAQTPARPGWIGYSVAALRTALLRPVELVFCGHLFLAPLAALIGELKAGPPQVILDTEFGGQRALDELEDDPLPRIC